MIRRRAAFLALGVLALTGGGADAQQVRLTKLSDVSFGTLTTLTTKTNAQNVCAFATSLTGRYSVRASGSGTGGALTLAGSGAPMPYEVQWAGTPNQTTGTPLLANTTVGGFTDGDVLETCNLINTSSATLIVILRDTALASATAGSYLGTLTLVLAAQ
jgi:hypothetical protein